ncbi:hypothetical protein KORDIASMS9_00840 [Kordia sp. SMS9]|nr:hypothetical protein KORDIASMS9_00840 [Kordia sp. SMS9]
MTDTNNASDDSVNYMKFVVEKYEMPFFRGISSTDTIIYT